MPIRVIEDRLYQRTDRSDVTKKVSVEANGNLIVFDEAGWHVWSPPLGRWREIERTPRQPGDEELRP